MGRLLLVFRVVCVCVCVCVFFFFFGGGGGVVSIGQTRRGDRLDASRQVAATVHVHSIFGYIVFSTGIKPMHVQYYWNFPVTNACVVIIVLACMYGCTSLD